METLRNFPRLTLRVSEVALAWTARGGCHDEVRLLREPGMARGLPLRGVSLRGVRAVRPLLPARPETEGPGELPRQKSLFTRTGEVLKLSVQGTRRVNPAKRRNREKFPAAVLETLKTVEPKEPRQH